MSNENTGKHITAEQFSKLDFDTVTLLDLREPDEVLVSGIEGAINQCHLVNRPLASCLFYFIFLPNSILLGPQK